MRNTVFIGVGSNLGERDRMIQEARENLASYPNVCFKSSASVYETNPVGSHGQGMFLNTVWKIETALMPPELLRLLLAIEVKCGRERREKNGPRTLDLDLLFYGNCIISESELTVPHPRLHERWFVLKPLSDLCPDFIHPVLKKSVSELLDELNENCKRS